MATNRSHPPTLETLVKRTIIDERLFARGEKVLAAVSGGPDSMAMLHVLARLSGKLGFTLSAHGVDHGLRADAGLELDIAEALCRTLDVPFERTCVTLTRGGNLQARAREARFKALREAAASQRASVIATAHHADDRAETVLLRLLQGSGPVGLACLPARTGDLVRPLIRARRRDVLAHLQRHNVAFSTDPSNVDTRFQRARIRTEVLPLLEGLSPSIVAHLNGLADDLQALCSPAHDAALAAMQTSGLRRVHRRQVERAGTRGAQVLLTGHGQVHLALSDAGVVITKERPDR